MADGALAWVNGQVVPRAEAAVSIDDMGFLYGTACFETMRAYDGCVFRLDRHLDRLALGLSALGVEPPAPRGLQQAVEETLRANGLADARVRLTVTPGRGSGRPGLQAAAGAGPTVVVVAEPPPAPAGPAALLVAATRVHERRPLARAKHAHFLPYLLARAEAQAAGCDEALMLNGAGRVAEAATANIFAVFDGRLVTPPIEEGPLPGVTREAVLECAAALAVGVEERPLELAGAAGLLGAAEVFLTSSVVGIRPVARIDGRAFAGAAGPLTHALASAYGELVQEEEAPA